MRALLEAAGGDWRGAIICGFTTGARLGDVANLRWEDIDFDHGVIAFVQGKTQSEVVIGSHPDFEAYLRSVEAKAGLRGVMFSWYGLR